MVDDEFSKVHFPFLEVGGHFEFEVGEFGVERADFTGNRFVAVGPGSAAITSHRKKHE